MKITVLKLEENSSNYMELSKYIEGKEISFIPLSMQKLGLYFNTFVRKLTELGIDVFNIDYNNINDKNNLLNTG